jgi:hypothetical protein
MIARLALKIKSEDCPAKLAESEDPDKRRGARPLSQSSKNDY